MKDRCRRWLLLFFVLSGSGSGYAGRGVQPPSPARDLPVGSFLDLKTPEHEHYYILVFGSQLPSRMPRYTHTWATVVKTIEPPGVCPQVVEVHTISWMPATLKIRPFRCRVQQGVNLDLCTTIQETLRHRERVSLWGPYETWQGFYLRFVMQQEFLDTGALGYQCTDQFGQARRTGTGCNCFHAISDMDPQFDRRQYPLIGYGEAASENIVRQLFARPILIGAPHTHAWLIPALGIDCYPIARRQYDGPYKEFSPEALREEITNPTPPPRRLRVRSTSAHRVAESAAGR